MRESITGYIIHQLRTTFGIMHNKSTGGKLIRGLFHQINAVDNEIKFRNYISLGKIIS